MTVKYWPPLDWTRNFCVSPLQHLVDNTKTFFLISCALLTSPGCKGLRMPACTLVEVEKNVEAEVWATRGWTSRLECIMSWCVFIPDLEKQKVFCTLSGHMCVMWLLLENWSSFCFTQVVYFGDSMRSDIFPASSFGKWETVMIVEEMEGEGVPKSDAAMSNEAQVEPLEKKGKFEASFLQQLVWFSSHSLMLSPPPFSSSQPPSPAFQRALIWE